MVAILTLGSLLLLWGGNHISSFNSDDYEVACARYHGYHTSETKLRKNCTPRTMY